MWSTVINLRPFGLKREEAWTASGFDTRTTTRCDHAACPCVRGRLLGLHCLPFFARMRQWRCWHRICSGRYQRDHSHCHNDRNNDNDDYLHCDCGIDHGPKIVTLNNQATRMSWSSECNCRTWVRARVSYFCLKMIVRWNKARQFHTSDGTSFETRDCEIGCAWVHSGEPYSWSRAHVMGPSSSTTTSVNCRTDGSAQRCLCTA